jgi:hypothetical protein
MKFFSYISVRDEKYGRITFVVKEVTYTAFYFEPVQNMTSLCNYYLPPFKLERSDTEWNYINLGKVNWLSEKMFKNLIVELEGKLFSKINNN